MKILSLIFLLTASSLVAAVAPNVVRSEIAGMDVYVDKTSVRDVVILRGSWPAGDAYAPAGNPTLATLVAGMLDKGTTKRDKFAVAKQLEDLGATIRFGAGDSLSAEFTATCLKEDIPVVVGLLAEQLRYPAFDETEFEKYKKQLSASIRQSTQDTGRQADRAFVRAAYPAGHVNRLASPDEWLKGVEAATLADVKAFHAAHYGTSRMTLVAVGDVTTSDLTSLLVKEFSGWAGEQPSTPIGSSTGASGDKVPREQTVFIPGKTSVNLVIGHSTRVRYSDPDSLPLRLGSSILGTGFTGRLMKQLREKEGLTYGIFSSLNNDTFTDGDWQITATFAPALLDKGIASTRKVVGQWLESGVTADELALVKTGFVGRQQVGLATTSGLATALMTTIERGMPLSSIDDFPARIDAVTVEQVNSAIKKHLSADKLVLIQAGTIGSP